MNDEPAKQMEKQTGTQWAFLGKPFSKPPEASNLIFFAQLNPVCVINALASKNIQLYGPQGPQKALKDPKQVFEEFEGFFQCYHFLFWLFMVNFNHINVIDALAR